MKLSKKKNKNNKAKNKAAEILKGIFDNPEFPLNPESTKFELKIDDPLVTAIQSVIEEKLGVVKLEEIDIIPIIKNINESEIMSNWWHLGWSFKCDMLEKWLGKYKASENIDNITEDEYKELNQKLSV